MRQITASLPTPRHRACKAGIGYNAHILQARIPMLLSIESSCDDSSIAITEIDSRRLIFHHKISQDTAHGYYGGVVPEIASRLHAKSLPEILEKLRDVLGGFSCVRGVALTTEPGLSVSLIEGLMMAKLLCLSLRIPLISVNHLIGHFYSLFINKPRAIFPMSVLLVSGGHTQIVEARSEQDFVIIAQSLDDSFGESFDKVAKMLGLGYPGGPIIESYAKSYMDSMAESSAIDSGANISHTHRRDSGLHAFPLPLRDRVGFSFSGLKNAARLLIESTIAQSCLESTPKNTQHNPAMPSDPSALSQEYKSYICASFQEAAIRHIAHQVERYFKTSRDCGRVIGDFAIVGGASSNAALRSRVQELCDRFGAKLHLAPLEFCADNAAMIGRAGIAEWEAGRFVDVVSQEISPRSTTQALRLTPQA